jgi:hypothetical protein
MRLKILSGAPIAEHLDFDEGSLLEPATCTLFTRCLAPSARDPVRWRRVTAASTRLRSSWSQPYLPASRSNVDSPQPSLPGLMPDYSVIAANEDTTELDGQAQQSLLFHDTLVSSQIAGTNANDTVSSSSLLTDSFDVTTADDEESNPSGGKASLPFLPRLPGRVTLTQLQHLPSPTHLRSIQPQTITVNLLCAVATELERRDVFVRRGSYLMHLHELTVADDTRSGFKISFWLRPSRSNRVHESHQESLRDMLDQVSVGDVLLLLNVALTTFRNDVFGQGLNTAITKAKTTMHMLHRGDASASFTQGSLPEELVDRLATVRKWASNYIAPGVSRGHKRRRGERYQQMNKSVRTSSPAEDSLPPDTMET